MSGCESREAILANTSGIVCHPANLFKTAHTHQRQGMRIQERPADPRKQNGGRPAGRPPDCSCDFKTQPQRVRRRRLAASPRPTAPLASNPMVEGSGTLCP